MMSLIIEARVASYEVFIYLRRRHFRTLKRIDRNQPYYTSLQLDLVPSVRSFSPFALKLETWLRVTGSLSSK